MNRRTDRPLLGSLTLAGCTGSESTGTPPPKFKPKSSTCNQQSNSTPTTSPPPADGLKPINSPTPTATDVPFPTLDHETHTTLRPSVDIVGTDARPDNPPALAVSYSTITTGSIDENPQESEPSTMYYP